MIDLAPQPDKGGFLKFLAVGTGVLFAMPWVISCRGNEGAPVSGVSSREAIAAARVTQMGSEGRMTATGSGGSMAPVYGDNTLLVIHPVDYADLEPGMIVAYRSSRGTNVVHRLVRRESSGWVAEGINNPREDTERVTESNLVGVVYATFQTE